MSAYPKWTIAIRPDLSQPACKITKIIVLRDGFSVLTPYHKANQGYVCKVPVDPDIKGPHLQPFATCIGFTSESRVKLSYHEDGFVQFSGENTGAITSGRDDITGAPKGCAIFTHPLSSPISSGPSVSITLWGLNDFELITASDRDTLIFEPSRLFYADCSPDSANCWVLEIHVVPCKLIGPSCRWEGNHLVTDTIWSPDNSSLKVVRRYSLLLLEKQNVFLALAVDGMIGNFPPVSGWLLGGPGDWAVGKKGHVLMAAYPREGIPVKDIASLDR